jgi:PAS domain S-box-containing protein
MPNSEQERSLDGLRALGGEIVAATLESFPDAVALSRAVHDAEGRIIDMRLVWMNQAARARQPDPDAAIGGLCSLLWPQMVVNGSFAECMKVLTTGEPAAGEFHWTEGSSFQPAYYDYKATRIGADLLLWVLRDSSDRLRKTLAQQGRLDAILRTAPDAVFVIDERGVLQVVNQAAERLFGWSASELIGRDVSLLMGPTDAAAHAGYLSRYLAGGEAHVIGRGRDVWARARDGRMFPARLTVGEANIGRERVFTGILHDLTAQQSLQSQLLQAQKLEVIGHLAAGVAHDFSNILTVINAACSLLECDLEGTPSGPLVAEILDASERASTLTRQLLAFSRPRALALVDLDINHVVRGAERMLGRLLGSRVDLELLLGPDLWTVQVDPGLLEQVLLNLAVNARDAMPAGGALRVETANERDDLTTGWVRMSVVDSGQGMTPEVSAHIFEPFFTTKPASRGTGLGLATVQRVVDGLGGRIRVESAPGHGARFDILLPRSHAPAQPLWPRPPEAVPRGHERVLVVDDEPSVRALCGRMLRSLGYDVVEATGPADAMSLSEPAALLVADVMMPGLSGPELARRLRGRWPGLRVLHVTGDPNDVQLSDATEAVLLRKPFNLLELAVRVREALDAPPRHPPE